MAMQGSALIVEDHPLYGGALMHLLQQEFGEGNAACAASAEAGLRMASAMPGLRMVLLDMGLPGVNGVEAVQAFQRHCPEAVVMVVSACEDRRTVSAALHAGAAAYISKASSMAQMREAINSVMQGSLAGPRWITPQGARELESDEGPLLTRRQMEVLALLEQGCTNKEISLRLSLALVTVKVNVSAIFRALNVVNRTQAVLAARRLGLRAVQDT